VNRGELEQLANRMAHTLAGQGVGAGDRVTLSLPNSIEFLAAVYACWKLGATPQPISAWLPEREFDAIVELAQPRVVIDQKWEVAADAPDTPLADVVSDPWKAMTSGGSTGRPKLILAGGPGTIDPEAHPSLLIVRDGTHMMPGPLYHNGPFVWSTTALLGGNHVVLGGKFDAQRTLELIDRHHPETMYIVPTMMARIWKLPIEVRESYDVSSLKAVWHLAAPCPVWLKEAWIEWLGPDAIYELYAGTEAQSATIITGREWLEHKGSVGKPMAGEMQAFDENGNQLPPGEVGEIYMRAPANTKTYEYVGATARTLPGGWESLGDMGSVDADGYIYLSDRQTDMILVGGANVYPAEIEAALDEHPRVRSSAVVGLPDDDLGSRPHAIVQTDDGGAIDEDDIRAHLVERLVRYKIPRSFEFVAEPLRDDAGKVRRSALRAERV